MKESPSSGEGPHPKDPSPEEEVPLSKEKKGEETKALEQLTAPLLVDLSNEPTKPVVKQAINPLPIGNLWIFFSNFLRY